MKGEESRQPKIARGLRFRLTLSYVVFLAILLSFLGFFFRQTLRTLYEGQMRHILSEEWAAFRGYLRIEKPRDGGDPKANWYYDRDDPEEALIVDRLKQVYLLTDANGEVLEIGPAYSELDIESHDEIRRVLQMRGPQWKIKKNRRGESYLIRSGFIVAEDDKPYFVAIGRSYREGDRIIDEFTRSYSILLPLMIVSASVLSWFVAGRALSPVNALARTARRITGSDMNVRIPPRGAGDELDHLIEAFNRMIERLDASLQQARQFSTDVSHELRTPLTAIRGQLEVAILAARTPEQYQEAILNALQDVERLSQTIRALLLLSQAESGQLALQKQKINLCELTSQVVEQFEIPAEGSNLTLESSLPSQCTIEADKVQIERLVANLLSNAIKYTPAGGRIRVTLEDQQSDVLLVVEDNGVGIPADHLPHIFDRFYRVPGTEHVTPDRDPERGLGLGLSFVAWIVKVHRGTINVQSQPNRGTRFEVRIPKEDGAIRQLPSNVPTAAAVG